MDLWWPGRQRPLYTCPDGSRSEVPQTVPTTFVPFIAAAGGNTGLVAEAEIYSVNDFCTTRPTVPNPDRGCYYIATAPSYHVYDPAHGARGDHARAPARRGVPNPGRAAVPG